MPSALAQAILRKLSLVGSLSARYEDEFGFSPGYRPQILGHSLLRSLDLVFCVNTLLTSSPFLSRLLLHLLDSFCFSYCQSLPIFPR
jgi:hypothetical protein